MLTDYKAADFFIFRSAHLPIESLEHVELNHMLEIFESNLLFQEAVLLASPTLAKAIIRSGKQKEIEQSLLKYYCRMGSRATPFGLFASVGFGKMRKKSSIFFDPEKVKKKTRALKSGCFSGQLYVNPHIIEKGAELIIPTVFQGKRECISMRKTAVWDLVIAVAKHSTSYSVIEEKLLEQYPQVEKERITTYVQTLMRNKFLLVENEESKEQKMLMRFMKMPL